MRLWFFCLVILFACIAQAYRMPSSLSQGPYISNEGFKIESQKTGWLRSNPPENLKDRVDALFTRKNNSSESMQTTFTVRIDKDTPYKTLQEYSKKWLRSYGQFGLEVLGHQYFKTKNDQQGFVIDIANSTSQKRLRQVIFFKNSKAVILTCMDQKEFFKKNLKHCNDLIKTFSWNEAALPSPETLF